MIKSVVLLLLFVVTSQAAIVGAGGTGNQSGGNPGGSAGFILTGVPNAADNESPVPFDTTFTFWASGGHGDLADGGGGGRVDGTVMAGVEYAFVQGPNAYLHLLISDDQTSWTISAFDGGNASGGIGGIGGSFNLGGYPFAIGTNGANGSNIPEPASIVLFMGLLCLSMKRVR